MSHALAEGIKASIGIGVLFLFIAAIFSTVNGELTSVGTGSWSTMAVTGWDFLSFGLPIAAFIYAIGWVADVF